MFGRRPDATPVSELSAMRRFMPYVSSRRNDSVFHLAQDIDVEAALELLEKKNRERSNDRPITLFHLLLRSSGQGLELRPGVNRFVKGGRLWQRDGVWLTFSAETRGEDGSPLITVKRRFDPAHESLDQMLDGVYGLIRPAPTERTATSNNNFGVPLRLPGFVIRATMGVMRFADRFGLLPRGMIEADPLYASIFFADAGSVGHEAGFHHLWEHGTCSIFCVMSKIKPGPDGRRFMTVCWTYDERIEDGLYSSITIAGIKKRIENPELLELSTRELKRR
jgi:hypothetical protein